MNEFVKELKLDKEQEQEEAEHIKKIYADKAGRLLKWVLGILIFDFVTYLVFILIGDTDFGVFFEIITFIFVIISIWLISKYSLEQAKSKVIIAMIPIGWLLIYDLIDLFSHIEQIVEELTNYYYNLEFFFLDVELYLVDIPLLIILLLLFKSYTSLCKALGDKKYQESTDWFYDKK